MNEALEAVGRPERLLPNPEDAESFVFVPEAVFEAAKKQRLIALGRK